MKKTKKMLTGLIVLILIMASAAATLDFTVSEVIANNNDAFDLCLTLNTYCEGPHKGEIDWHGFLDCCDILT